MYDANSKKEFCIFYLNNAVTSKDDGIIMLNINRAADGTWALKIRGYYAEGNKTYRDMVDKVEGIMKNDFSKVHIP